MLDAADRGPARTGAAVPARTGDAPVEVTELVELVAVAAEPVERGAVDASFAVDDPPQPASGAASAMTQTITDGPLFIGGT